MNYVQKHSQDHANSECVSYVGVDHKEYEFTGKKQTYRHSTSYISTKYLK